MGPTSATSRGTYTNRAPLSLLALTGSRRKSGLTLLCAPGSTRDTWLTAPPCPLLLLPTVCSLLWAFPKLGDPAPRGAGIMGGAKEEGHFLWVLFLGSPREFWL